MAQENDLSEEELSSLSETEREAYLDGLNDNDSLDDIRDLAGVDDEDDDDDKNASGDAEDKTNSIQVTDDEDLDDEKQPVVAVFKADMEGFEEKMAAISDEKKALRNKFNEGELTIDEYEEQKDALVQKEVDLKLQNNTAKISQEMEQQTSQKVWDQTQKEFFAEEQNKQFITNKYLTFALDKAVRDIASDPAKQSYSPMKVLREAAKEVRAAFGQPDPQASNKDGDKNKTPVQRKADLSKLPKTLANLPSAEIAETDDDRFGHLEGLSGTKLERELAKLSPAEQEEYLRVGAG